MGPGRGGRILLNYRHGEVSCKKLLVVNTSFLARGARGLALRVPPVVTTQQNARARFPFGKTHPCWSRQRPSDPVLIPCTASKIPSPRPLALPGRGRRTLLN